MNKLLGASRSGSPVPFFRFPILTSLLLCRLHMCPRVHCTLGGFSPMFNCANFAESAELDLLMLAPPLHFGLVSTFLQQQKTIKDVLRIKSGEGGGQLCAKCKKNVFWPNLNFKFKTIGFLDTLKVHNHIQSNYLTRP